jgi:hypothetical protein
VAYLGRAHVREVEHLEFALRRHDVPYEKLFTPDTAVRDDLHRLLAEDIGRGDQPDDVSVLIYDEKQAHAPLQHPPVRLVHCIAR